MAAKEVAPSRAQNHRMPARPFKDFSGSVKPSRFRPRLFAYFETDFLNIRSIFSLIASMACWLLLAIALALSALL